MMCTHLHHELSDLMRDVTCCLFLTKHDITQHITGDMMRYLSFLDVTSPVTLLVT